MNPGGLFVSSSGNVGIGTTNPNALLEVVNGEIKAGRVNSSNEGGQVSFGRSTDNAVAWYIDAYGNVASPQLRFVDATAEIVRMTITGSNIGIGTTSPSDILDVQKNQNATTNIYFRNTDNTNANSRMYLNLVAGNAAAGIAVLAGGSGTGSLYIGGVNNGEIYFQPYLGGTVTMTLKSSGNVGIGITTPSYKLDVVSLGSPSARVRNGDLGGTATLLLETANNFSGTCQTFIQCIGSVGNGTSQLVFGTAGAVGDATATERMRITSEGNVTFQGNGNGFTIGQASGVNRIDHNGSTFRFLGTSNSFTPIAASAFNVNSDYRLKEDLKDFNGLDKVSAIKVYDFKWKNLDERTNGVLAHELAEVLPYAVSGVKDALNHEGKIEAQSVDYSKLTPVLVKAIQELNTKFEEYKATHP
jgi:hypothetical protein